MPNVPVFKSFADVRKYLDEQIARYRLRGNGPPAATLRARLGAQYTDDSTGELYVMQSAGWDGPK
jgi:hypothetical protein